MTAVPPKRPRGRPPLPLPDNPFNAPALDRARWAALVDALADALAAAPAPSGEALPPAAALAEAMFPTPGWPRYRKADGSLQRRADGREREAVERWLLQRHLPWLTAIEAARRTGEVKRWGEGHARLATALEAFCAAPDDRAKAQAAAAALSLLPPDPAVPGQQPLPPDPERLTPERLLAAPGGDPVERAATAHAAAELAEDCRRLAADVRDWRAENSHGRRALAHTVALTVAELFDAADAGKCVHFGRESSAATPRGPVGPYCAAVERVLRAIGGGHLALSWRSATEAVCNERAAAAGC